MKIDIQTDNSISIDGKQIGLSVTQKADKTVVYVPESMVSGVRYKEYPMPALRYSLAHDAPASGAAGRGDFERDLMDLIQSRPVVIVEFDIHGNDRQYLDQTFETEAEAEQYLSSWIKERAHDDFCPTRGDFAIRRKF